MKKIFCVCVAAFFAAIAIMAEVGGIEPQKSSYIKYVEFNVTKEAMHNAVDTDIKTEKSKHHVDCVTSLAYLAAKYGGDFTKYKSADLYSFAKKISDGDSVEKITKDNKYFKYYKEAYSAAIGGMTGKFEEENSKGETTQEYGVRWFSPIAKTFPYSCYDDFGAVRTYGYTRPHLGHDLMAAIGTPVIAVESGKIEVMGWNMYGGWRIGIRSKDNKRYWYYAHLRQNRPFAENLKEGDTVTAGDVIGYVGRTGYSNTENVNNITENHLHIGLELVFDEKQKESDNEIWVNLNAITDILECHQSAVLRNTKTKEFKRQFSFKEIE